MAVRDLGPAYGKLRNQPACAQHRDRIDAVTRSRRRMPPTEDPVEEQAAPTCS